MKGRKPQPGASDRSAQQAVRLLRLDFSLAALIALAALAAMARAVLAQFINYDDPDFVPGNPAVQAFTIANLRAIWFSFEMPQYYPIVFTSYLLEHTLFGLNPHAFHATNVLLHALNSALAFFLVLKLTRSRLAAFVAGMLFAVHPVHVESVAWVTERKDVLSAPFFFGAFLLYLRYSETGRKPSYVCSLVLFFFGLLAKTMIATLPLWLLVVDWVEGRRPAKKALIEKIPYFALALLMPMATWINEHQGWSPEGSRLAGVYSPLSAFAAPAFYLQKALFPVGLSMSYPPLHTGPPLLAFRILISSLLIAGAALLLYRRRKEGMFLMFFFAGILPVVGILPFRYVMIGSPVADRFLYLPVLGFLGAFAVAAAAWAGASAIRQKAVVALCLLAACLLGAASWVRCGVFHDTGSVFADALNKDDTSVASNISRLNLGIYLTDQNRLKEAEPYLREVVRRVPGSGRPRHVLGMLRLKQGRTPEAIVLFREALVRSPGQKAYRLSLADALLMSGKADEARSEYEQVLARNARSPGALDGLGAVALTRGEAARALDLFGRAQSVSPPSAERRYRMALAFRMLGRPRDAIRELREAVGISPESPEIRLRLADMLKLAGDVPGAIEQYRQGLHAAADNVDLLNSFAWTVATSGRSLAATPAEGVAAAEKARKISGGNVPYVLDTLAAAYARAGDFPAAVRTQRECIALLRASGKPAGGESSRLKLYLRREPFHLR